MERSDWESSLRCGDGAGGEDGRARDESGGARGELSDSAQRGGASSASVEHRAGGRDSQVLCEGCYRVVKRMKERLEGMWESRVGVWEMIEMVRRISAKKLWAIYLDTAKLLLGLF